ncbi:DUF7146 domain-containing protein [Terrihabitans rhizophilus]|uniref:Primase-helicase zinc-binding domain-containing protein n=1 Tax=Terrihabitans rhizophilus TaxID=3092662 RepID=A0ABU4RQF8_9HYPH|nr:primase-helicase zinc-binding domain-containing protein [Terrihabitans sp. PJ23]MDX6806334.1 primase-helicase zinc-binding domain-containing protein [Terrihabitans sp. PJ23]
MTAPARDRCQGRWREILPRFGVDARYLTGKHGPCPICVGRDRFRFDDKEGRGTWICSQCGAGDGFALAMGVKKLDFREVAAEIETFVENMPRTAPKVARSDVALREAMNRLWSGSKPLVHGDPVAAYLERRGIRLQEFPTVLRHAESCLFVEGGSSTYHPAMLAKVTAPDGKPATIHRTYLTNDGQKAPVSDPRRIMPGKIEKGSAIRLAPAAPIMGIAEGIETALSAAIIWGIPCWAAVNSAMLMGWEPPECAAEIYVFGDNDEKFGGQSAAYALAHRLAAGQRALKARVELPIDPGLDWNDALQAETKAA